MAAPATIPWNQASIDALANAIGRGARVVEYQGTGRVEYQSLADMQKLLDRMVRQVNNQGDGVPVPNARPSVFLRR